LIKDEALGERRGYGTIGKTVVGWSDECKLSIAIKDIGSFGIINR
jgi:hypothetical protein